MKINWQLLEANQQRLYCYAITVGQGTVLRNRAYYEVEQIQTNKTMNCALDTLIETKLATCFSCGYEKDGNIIKHDLHIKTEQTEKIYKKLSAFNFFDIEKVELLKMLSEKKDFPIKNEIMGAKISIADYSLKNVCLYFKCLKNPKIIEYRDYIYCLCDKYNLRHDFVLMDDDEHFLRLIALDFSKDIFKLKIYFQFRPEYNLGKFIDAFRGSENQCVVNDVVNSNGWICAFQIATMDSQEITYNFYMKERGASF